MKREYFGILFIVISVIIIFAAGAVFGNEIVFENIGKFIVIWLLVAFYARQYSMKFPKAF